jgi:cell division protein FtsB
MRRDEVHELFERVEKQLRESEDDARLKSAEAVKLQKEYRGVVARMKPLKAERDRITERARRLGISFKDYGDSEGEIYIQ